MLKADLTLSDEETANLKDGEERGIWVRLEPEAFITGSVSSRELFGSVHNFNCRTKHI